MLADENGKALKPNSSRVAAARAKTKKTRVLGKETLHALWSDMGKTVLPSWVTRGPKEVGTARCGKLSADQWRSTCSIHLVVTLIRLWGDEPRDSRFFLMLTNFMDLVSATKLATARSLSESKITQYELHMKRYLSDMLSLFPHKFVSPNQHLSLHLGKFLRAFGPTHAWGTWAAERMNHVLQGINTNMRFGPWMFRLWSFYLSNIRSCRRT